MRSLNTVEKLREDTKSIIIISDEKLHFSMSKFYLENEGYAVSQVSIEDSILNSIVENKPDLIMVEITSNEICGVNTCQTLRNAYSGPIIVLSTDASEQQQIDAYRADIDDYLVQPVSPKILEARIAALIRRHSDQKSEGQISKIQVGDVCLYPLSHKCEVKGNSIHLSTFEFRLLGLLLTNVGKIMSRDSIYKLLLGREYNGEERTVDVRVSKLRDKLANEGVEYAKIETVWGQGYILNEIS